MTTSEKILILIVAIAIVAALIPAIHIWLRNTRTKQRANQTNRNINRLK